jgi:putative molybdopterin biosynthesis protein
MNSSESTRFLPQNIKGDEHEETNHLSVASAVSTGADVGVGIEKAVKSVGVDFIPLITERYNPVILKLLKMSG